LERSKEQMGEEAYLREVSWRFWPQSKRHSSWRITEVTETYITFEETRKNGQEDTHMGGEAELIDGRWVLDKGTRQQIETYEGKSTADAIEAFFNEHGPPTEESAEEEQELKLGDVVHLASGSCAMTIMQLNPQSRAPYTCIWMRGYNDPQIASFPAAALVKKSSEP
jgi:uncharacterized protein YodC (DUF2158 family)